MSSPIYTRPKNWPLPDLAFLRWVLYKIWLANTTRGSFELCTGLYPNHSPSRTVHANLHEILLCAGIALSPATSTNDCRAWGFLIEHLDSFTTSQSRYLRVIDAAKEWDSRVKTLFAERLGVGFTFWLLWKHFDVEHIADAKPFIDRPLNDRGNHYHDAFLKIKNQHHRLCPDYFCLSNSGEAVIAESKGAIGTSSAVSKATRAKAKEQVRSVTPVMSGARKKAKRLTFATTIRLKSNNPRGAEKDTMVCVEDPDGEDGSLSAEINVDAFVQSSYKKFFNFIGLDWINQPIQQTIRNAISASRENPEYKNDEQVIFFVDMFYFRVGLLAKVAEELVEWERGGLHERVSNALNASRSTIDSINENENIVVFPNGIVSTLLREFDD